MIFVALAMLFTCSVWAQQDGQRREFNPEQSATRQAENLEKELGLDSVQYKQVYALYLEQSKQMQERMKQMREARERGEEVAQPQGGQPGQMPEEWKKMQEEFDAKMKAILTPEQFEKYQKMDRRGFGGRRGGNRQQN